MNKTSELGNCPFCLSPVKAEDQKVRCPKCGVTHHADCWRTNGQCSVYGCDGWAVWNEAIAERVAPISEDAVVVQEVEEAHASQVHRCIGCGREVRNGQVTCLSCFLRTQRYRFENCSGPSIIALTGLITVVTIVVRAIIS